MKLEFMGREFVNVEALRVEFPAFASDDAVRAIRAGARTPTEVEAYCWERRRAGFRRSREAARRNAAIVNEKAAASKARDAKKKRSARRGKAKAA